MNECLMCTSTDTGYYDGDIDDYLCNPCTKLF